MFQNQRPKKISTANMRNISLSIHLHVLICSGCSDNVIKFGSDRRDPHHGMFKRIHQIRFIARIVFPL